jgi:PmbA protein
MRKLKNINLTTSYGLSFRGKINGKIGYSYTEILDEYA